MAFTCPITIPWTIQDTKFRKVRLQVQRKLGQPTSKGNEFSERVSVSRFPQNERKRFADARTVMDSWLFVIALFCYPNPRKRSIRKLQKLQKEDRKL